MRTRCKASGVSDLLPLSSINYPVDEMKEIDNMKKRMMLSITVLFISMLVAYIIFMNANSNKVDIKFYNAVPIEPYSDEYLVSELPLFTNDDIKYYDWENQIIVFKKQSELNLSPLDGLEHNHITLSSFATTSRDKFYVYVNDELIYNGYYVQSPLSSFFALGITMKDIEDGVKIEYVTLENNSIDKRFDKRLYNALKANGLLLD